MERPWKSGVRLALAEYRDKGSSLLCLDGAIPDSLEPVGPSYEFSQVPSPKALRSKIWADRKEESLSSKPGLCLWIRYDQDVDKVIAGFARPKE